MPQASESIDDLLDDFITQANKSFVSASSSDWDLRTTDVELLDPEELSPVNQEPRHFKTQRRPEAKSQLTPPSRQEKRRSTPPEAAQTQAVDGPTAPMEAPALVALPEGPADTGAPATQATEPPRAAPAEPPGSAPAALAAPVETEQAPARGQEAEKRPAVKAPTVEVGTEESGGAHQAKTPVAAREPGAAEDSDAKKELAATREAVAAKDLAAEKQQKQEDRKQTLAAMEPNEVVARPLPMPKPVQRSGISPGMMIGGMALTAVVVVGVMRLSSRGGPPQTGAPAAPASAPASPVAVPLTAPAPASMAAPPAAAPVAVPVPAPVAAPLLPPAPPTAATVPTAAPLTGAGQPAVPPDTSAGPVATPAPVAPASAPAAAAEPASAPATVPTVVAPPTVVPVASSPTTSAGVPVAAPVASAASADRAEPQGAAALSAPATAGTPAERNKGVDKVRLRRGQTPRADKTAQADDPVQDDKEKERTAPVDKPEPAGRVEARKPDKAKSARVEKAKPPEKKDEGWVDPFAQ